MMKNRMYTNGYCKITSSKEKKTKKRKRNKTKQNKQIKQRTKQYELIKCTNKT